MSEAKNESSANGANLERIVMLPLRDEVSGHCLPECPYLKQWDHPFFHHTAWCWKQLRDLPFYDFWLADCLDDDPDKTLERVRHAGRTKAP